jgi:hydrogenase expression/formation protein HypC
MCLAVPGRIIEIDGTSAWVDFAGVEQTVLLDLLPDANVGEYVLVHAGFAIQRLDAAEAEEIIGLFEEMENAVRDEDSKSQS